MKFNETSLTSAQWFKTRFQILQILILIRYLRRLNFLIDELCILTKNVLILSFSSFVIQILLKTTFLCRLQTIVANLPQIFVWDLGKTRKNFTNLNIQNLVGLLSTGKLRFPNKVLFQL